MVVAYLRPDSDIGINDWTDDGGGAVSLAASLDETTSSDVDYIRSAMPAIGSPARFGLSDPATGKWLGDPLVVKYRIRRTSQVNHLFDVALYQGTSLIAIWEHVGVSSFISSSTSASVALSSDRLTATNTGPQYCHAFSNFNGIKDAKVYFEARRVVGGDTGFGIANTLSPSWSGDPAKYIGIDFNSAGIWGGGEVYYGGYTGTTIEMVSGGDWIGMAVDSVAKTISFRNVTSATGDWTTPFSIESVFDAPSPNWAGLIWFDMCMGADTTAEVNFEGPFVGEVPSGYGKWSASDRLTETFQTFSQTLTSAQLAWINRFNDLSVEVVALVP